MNSVREFLEMGGYGAFVWSAYGIWAAVMVWVAAGSLAHTRNVRRRVIARLRAEELEG